jgi:hypothetical protein
MPFCANVPWLDYGEWDHFRDFVEQEGIDGGVLADASLGNVACFMTSMSAAGCVSIEWVRHE